jgi:hypothetical protein
MKVNSYHEIKDINHAKAIKFLRSRLGELRNMPSAPKKFKTGEHKQLSQSKPGALKKGGRHGVNSICNRNLKKFDD